MANESANAAEQPRLRLERQRVAAEVRERERQRAGGLLLRPDQVDHRRQHQDAAERGVEDELDRGVDAPLAAPDADDQEHRDQHRFPEHVEQEQVLRQEGAQHRELDEEHHRVEQLHALRDRAERAGHHQRAEERGERHQQHVQAVEADVVVHAPVADPRHAGLELQARHRTVEPGVQPGRQHQLQQHHAEREAAHGPVGEPRRERQRQHAEHRQPQDQVQHGGLSHCPTSTRARAPLRPPRAAGRTAGCRSRPGSAARRCAGRGR